MQPLIEHRGVAALLLRNNIDTDAIIPSREMKTVSKIGLADGLFAGWRYQDTATGRDPDPGFVLNRPEQRGTSILIAGLNFGCGSSREHAVWALREFGIRVVIAPSFGAIFATNCVRNGLLPLVLPLGTIEQLANLTAADPATQTLLVNLNTCTLHTAGGVVFGFELAPSQRHMLMTGADPIALTLAHRADINAFQAQDRQNRPWVYLNAPQCDQLTPKPLLGDS